MVGTNVFDEGRLLETVRAMESRFSWDEDLRGLTPAGSWRSRTARLYELRSPSGGKAVVLKAGTEWSGDKAREVYEDLVQLREVYSTRPDLRINVPRALGWSDSPACVCTVRALGEDLDAQIGHGASYGSDLVLRAVRASGAALGLFHSSYLVSGADDVSAAERDLDKMARRLMLDREKFVGYGAQLPISRKYGDFYPHNLLVESDGTVWIIDQPSSHTNMPVHRDIAYFIDRLDTHVGRFDAGSEEERVDVVERLQQVFLDAYRETGPSRLETQTDRAVLSLYRSYKNLNTALKRFRQRRYTDIARYLVRAVDRRKVTRRF